MISRIRQRWAQSAPDRFVTLQPLPSSLTRALDSASPNPCPVSTGLSSDPVAPVSHQVAPLQMAIHSSWPSPSAGGAIRVPVPRALPALPLPPAPAPACRWRDGSYAPKYRPPTALQCGPHAPVFGPVSASLSAPVAAGGPCRSSCGPAFIFICSAWPAGFPSGRFCVGWPAACLAGHRTWPGPSLSVYGVSAAKLRLATQWAEIISQLGSASALFQEASATRDPDRHLRHPVLRFAPSTLQRYLADWISWHTFCLAVSADPPALCSSFLITAPMWFMPSVPRLTRMCWLSPTRRIRKPSSGLPAVHEHRPPSTRQSAARFRLQPRHACTVLARPLASSIYGFCTLGPFPPRLYLRFLFHPVPAAACPLTVACLACRAKNYAHLFSACLSAFCTDPCLRYLL